MKNFRKKLNREINGKKFDSSVKDNILNNRPAEVFAVPVQSKSPEEKNKKIPRFGIYAFTAVCLCVLIVVSVILLNTSKNPAVPGNSPVLLTVNINPAVEFTLDGEGNVTAQKGLNKDGEILLLGRDFTGFSSADAVKDVIISAEKLNLLKDNPINVMIINGDSKNVSGIEERFSSVLNGGVLSELGITNALYVNRFAEDIGKEASKYGISESLMQIVDSVCAKTGISVKKALEKPLEELVEIANGYDATEMKAFAAELDRYFENLEESMEEELEVFENELEALEDILEEMQNDNNYNALFYKYKILEITAKSSLFDGLFSDENELDWYLKWENLKDFFKNAENFLDSKEDLLDEIEDRFENRLEEYKESLIASVKG